MKWKCKFCVFSSNDQRIIIKHYKERHGHHRRSSGFVCIYEDCFNTFQTQTKLNKHLKDHAIEGLKIVTKLCCDLCTFSEPSNINKYFAHLKTHLKNRESVKCPFVGCTFKSSVLSTFAAHRSRCHTFSTLNSLRPELCLDLTLTNEVIEEDSVSHSEVLPSYDTVHEAAPTLDNRESIKNQVASLFLRMQTILHVSNSAIQEVIDELFDIGETAPQNLKKIIEKVLQENNYVADASVVTSLSDEIQSLNPLRFLSRQGPLGTKRKRQSFYGNNFTVIEPVEYVLN